MKKGQVLGFIEQLGTYVPVEVSFTNAHMKCDAIQHSAHEVCLAFGD